jgi:arylsulfate sulfotransferase
MKSLVLPTLGPLLLLCAATAADDQTAPQFSQPPAFELSREVPLAGVLSFTTDRACTASVYVVEGSTRTPVPTAQEPATQYEIPVLGLRADRDCALHVRIHARGQSLDADPLSFRTAPLPELLPTLRVTRSEQERMEPGVTLLSLFRWEDDRADNSFGYFVAVDAAGEVVWYYAIGAPAAGIHRLPNGEFQFIHGVPPKFIRRIDPLGSTLREFHAVALGDTLREGAIPVDVDTFHHDFAPQADDSLLALSTEVRRLERYPLNVARPRRGMGPANVVGDVVAHILPDGRVAKRWALLDILDPQRVTWSSHDSFWDQRAYHHIEEGTRDWSHANTIVRDPADGGLVLSLRHQDAVVKIDADTSAVKWILGSPANWRGELARKVLKPTARLEWPFHQHGVKFTPHGTLLMFDNGNLRAIPPARPMPPTEAYSRAVEYEIDEEEMSVTQVFSYGGPDDDQRFYSPFLCDADWLPQTGNILVTDGAHATDENGQPVNNPPGAQQWARLVEVTHEEDPHVVWELLIDDRQTRPRIGWSVYRSERLPSLYPAKQTSR